KLAKLSWPDPLPVICGFTRAIPYLPISARWAPSPFTSNNSNRKDSIMALTPRPSLKTLFTEQAKATRNRAAAGMFLSSGDAGIAVIVAAAGMDYLVIDPERSPMSVESVQKPLRAIAGYESIPVVRVPENDPHVIKQFLDLGARSLIVPMSFTPDDARK